MSWADLTEEEKRAYNRHYFCGEPLPKAMLAKVPKVGFEKAVLALKQSHDAILMVAHTVDPRSPAGKEIKLALEMIKEILPFEISISILNDRVNETLKTIHTMLSHPMNQINRHESTHLLKPNNCRREPLLEVVFFSMDNAL